MLLHAICAFLGGVGAIAANVLPIPDPRSGWATAARPEPGMELLYDVGLAFLSCVYSSLLSSAFLIPTLTKLGQLLTFI